MCLVAMLPLNLATFAEYIVKFVVFLLLFFKVGLGTYLFIYLVPWWHNNMFVLITLP